MFQILGGILITSHRFSHFSVGLVLLLILSAHSLGAQINKWRVLLYPPSPRRVHSLTVQDGLTQSYISTIAQDRDGFMWFGTPDGLNRFDGYEIVRFNSIAPDSLALRDNAIRGLMTDSGGVLSVGMVSAIAKLNYATNTFIFFPYPKAQRVGYISSICANADGKIWATYLTIGVVVLDPRSGVFRTIQHASGEPHSLTSNIVYCSAFDRGGRLWVGSDKGIDVVDTQSLTVTKHFPMRQILHRSRSAFRVNALLRDRRGRMWIGTTGGGVYRYDNATQQFVPFEFRSANSLDITTADVRAVLEDRAGRVLVGLYGLGLYVADEHERALSKLSSEVGDVIGNGVASLCEDRAGNLWVGTDDGVRWVNLKRKRFSSVVETRKEERLFGKEFVMTLNEDRHGTLWLSMHRLGLFRIAKDGNTQRVSNNGNTVSHVQAIIADVDGAIWACGEGLEKYSADGMLLQRYVHHADDSLTIASNNIMSALFDHDGHLWVGYNSGAVDRFDAATGQAHHVRLDSLASSGRRGMTPVFSIVEDRDKQMWIGGAGGLMRISRTTGVVRRYDGDAAGARTIGKSSALSLAISPKGVLWIGTANGLLRYETSQDTFMRITERDGMPNDKVWSLLVDKRERVWAGTNRGLSRISFDHDGRLSIRTYGIEDGLPALEFTRNAACVTRTGHFLFATSFAVIRFHPDSVVDDANAPPIAFTAFKKFDEVFDFGENLNTIPQVVLPYSDNVFSLRFAALEFVEPSMNRYSYIMEGFEDAWTHAGTRREVRYTHLDPGSYTFRVNASNYDGVWRGAERSLRIVILPPFWRTWWFMLLCLAAVGGVLSLVMRYRVNKALEIERTRTRIAADLHDELGSTLSAIALSSETLRDNPKLDEAERERAAVISEYARRTSDAMREIVWFVKPEHDSPEQLLLKMRDVAYTTLADVAVNVRAEPDVLNGVKYLEQRRNLFLIYKEVLTNIARHAKCSRVEILLQHNDGMLTLRVEDDGVGFDFGVAQGKGNGLSNLRQRAVRIGGTLKIESTMGKGSVVELCIHTS